MPHPIAPGIPSVPTTGPTSVDQGGPAVTSGALSTRTPPTDRFAPAAKNGQLQEIFKGTVPAANVPPMFVACSVLVLSLAAGLVTGCGPEGDPLLEDGDQLVAEGRTSTFNNHATRIVVVAANMAMFQPQKVQADGTTIALNWKNLIRCFKDSDCIGPNAPDILLLSETSPEHATAFVDEISARLRQTYKSTRSTDREGSSGYNGTVVVYRASRFELLGEGVTFEYGGDTCAKVYQGGEALKFKVAALRDLRAGKTVLAKVFHPRAHVAPSECSVPSGDNTCQLKMIQELRSKWVPEFDPHLNVIGGDWNSFARCGPDSTYGKSCADAGSVCAQNEGYLPAYNWLYRQGFADSFGVWDSTLAPFPKGRNRPQFKGSIDKIHANARGAGSDPTPFHGPDDDLRLPSPRSGRVPEAASDPWGIPSDFYGTPWSDHAAQPAWIWY